MEEIEQGIELTVACYLATTKLVLLARAIGWEAPPWAATDRSLVASVIRYRMLARDLSLEDVLFAPYQFQVAPLLNKDPPDMPQLMTLAGKAMGWQLDNLPVRASHFWSPKMLDQPPFWADTQREVEVDDGAIHRYYLLPDWGMR